MTNEIQSSPHEHKPARHLVRLLSLLFVCVIIGWVGAISFANAFKIHQEVGWHPTWSPDGKYIAITSNYAGGVGCTDIDRIDADGTNRTQLTFSRFQFVSFSCIARDEDPAWSPDGEKIAFVSDRKSFPWNKTLDIYVMDTNGSGIRRLTKHGGNSILDPLSQCSHPTWSPDGKMIAFVCQYIKDTFDTVDEGIPAIYLMNADGSNLHKVVDIETSLYVHPEHSPSWSPDSHSIIFVQDDVNNGSAIYRIKIDGIQEKRLSRSFIMFSNAAWSPDGSRILFIGRDTSADPAADAYFYLMNVDDTHIRRVVRFHGDVYPYVSWSPDGKQIAFDDGSRTLFIMNTDGTGLRQLTKQ